MRSVRTVLFAFVVLVMSSASFGQVRISVSFGPPALPVYEQLAESAKHSTSDITCQSSQISRATVSSDCCPATRRGGCLRPRLYCARQPYIGGGVIIGTGLASRRNILSSRALQDFLRSLGRVRAI